MAVRVKWLKAALRDFDAEISYIAADDPEAARQVAGRIEDSIALLASHPAIGRPGRIAGTRELVVPNTRYLIPYRFCHGAIEVLRLFHASRRPPKR